MTLYDICIFLTRAAWIAGLLLSVVIFLLWFYQEKLLFYPGVPKGFETPDRNPKGLRHPGERNLPHEDVYFETSDGLTLHGWLLLQSSSLDSPTILYFHGNAGNIGFRLPNIEHMYKQVNANVLIVSYRGYGYSEGRPTENGVYLDAEAALDFLMKQPTINKHSIFLFGRSIGGAVAIELARRRERQIRGVIVENTFTSVIDMLFIIFPSLRPLRIIVRIFQRLYMKNDEKVQHLQVPFLFISGRQDQLVPPSQMDTLYQVCGSKLKEREDVLLGGHNDTWEVGGRSYYESLARFIQAALKYPNTHRVSITESTTSTEEQRSSTCSTRDTVQKRSKAQTCVNSH